MISEDLRDRILEIAWQAARAVPDPEMPFLTVGDLGVLRSVSLEGEQVQIAVSPTYSGCPAVTVIETSIKSAVTEALDEALTDTESLTGVEVTRALSPAWTSDDLSAEARAKLLENGIAPPVSTVGFAGDRSIANANVTSDTANTSDYSQLQPNFFAEAEVNCPRCQSSNTQRISEFGSTPCKSQYRCESCKEPFDHFKCLR